MAQVRRLAFPFHFSNQIIDAKTNATVYFSAPLYRKNLHYQILPKPSSAAAAITAMKDYILENHPNQTGIVYCFTKKVTCLPIYPIRLVEQFLRTPNAWRKAFLSKAGAKSRQGYTTRSERTTTRSFYTGSGGKERYKLFVPPSVIFLSGRRPPT
jgi:hypothetical protein